MIQLNSDDIRLYKNENNLKKELVIKNSLVQGFCRNYIPTFQPSKEMLFKINYPVKEITKKKQNIFTKPLEQLEFCDSPNRRQRK